MHIKTRKKDPMIIANIVSTIEMKIKGSITSFLKKNFYNFIVYKKAQIHHLLYAVISH
jgi:hypothetical protein